MLKLYTSQLYKVDQSNPSVINITIKSATTALGRDLAPTRSMVYGHKAGKGDPRYSRYTPLTDQQYTQRYYALLRPRYDANRDLFHNALRQEKIILCCYCAKGSFCHRHLAVDILHKIAIRENIPIQLCGEI